MPAACWDCSAAPTGAAGQRRFDGRAGAIPGRSGRSVGPRRFRDLRAAGPAGRHAAGQGVELRNAVRDGRCAGRGREVPAGELRSPHRAAGTPAASPGGPGRAAGTAGRRCGHPRRGVPSRAAAGGVRIRSSPGGVRGAAGDPQSPAAFDYAGRGPCRHRRFVLRADARLSGALGAELAKPRTAADPSWPGQDAFGGADQPMENRPAAPVPAQSLGICQHRLFRPTQESDCGPADPAARLAPLLRRLGFRDLGRAADAGRRRLLAVEHHARAAYGDAGGRGQDHGASASAGGGGESAALSSAGQAGAAGSGPRSESRSSAPLARGLRRPPTAT